MRIATLAIFLLIILLRVDAQKISAGFYVNLQGEKIAGSFSDFRQWNYNPSKVSFAADDKTSIVLTPENCISFTVSGYDTYIAKTVSRMTDAETFSTAVNREGSSEHYDTINVFLRRIFDQPGISLYEYSDKLRKNYYIQHGNDFAELIFKVDYTGGRTVEDKRYLSQLQTLYASQLIEDNKAVRKLFRTEYDGRDLVSFLNHIHDVKQPEKAKELAYPTEIVFSAGASYNVQKVGPLNLGNPRTYLDYSSNIAPLVGIGFIRYGQRNFGKYYWNVDLKYTSFRNISGYSGSHRWEYKSHVASLSVGGGIKWINKKNFAWYTSASSNIIFLLGNTEVATYNDKREEVKGNGELDFQTFQHANPQTTAEMLTLFEEGIAAASDALSQTNDEALQEMFTLKANGKVLYSSPKIIDIGTTLNHWVHHRGQLTVYMRMNGIAIPSLYGPSADDQQFTVPG